MDERQLRALAQAEITAEERARVLALVEDRGMRVACEELRLDRSTVQRILSPLKVRQQTALWLRVQLERLEIRA